MVSRGPDLWSMAQKALVSRQELDEIDRWRQQAPRAPSLQNRSNQPPPGLDSERTHLIFNYKGRNVRKDELRELLSRSTPEPRQEPHPTGWRGSVPLPFYIHPEWSAEAGKLGVVGRTTLFGRPGEATEFETTPPSGPEKVGHWLLQSRNIESPMNNVISGELRSLQLDKSPNAPAPVPVNILHSTIPPPADWILPKECASIEI